MSLARLVTLVTVLFVGLAVLGAILGPASSTETRYAQMGREMLESGDWVVPTLNGAPLLEKPPFEYWVNAASIGLFGHNDVAARVPSLVAGLLVLLVVAYGARRFAPEGDLPEDRRARGRLAALALATMPGFLVQSYTISTDIWLVLATTIAGLALLESDRTGGRPGRAWTLTLHAATGVAMLIKGPLTLGLVFGAGAVTALVRRSPRLLRPFANPLGIALFVAITVPWYVAANARIPGLLHDLVTRRLFGGLASSADFHGHSVWIVWLPLVGAFPWLATLPRTLASTLRGGGWRRGIAVPAFLLAASAPLLFTFSKARLFSYASPAFPWLALLVAFGWPTPGSDPASAASRGRRVDLTRATFGAAIVAVGAAVWTLVGIEAPALVAAVGCLGAALAFAALGVGGRREAHAPFGRAALVVTGLMIAGGAGAVAAPGQFDASKSLADAIARVRRPGEEVGAVMPYTGDWGLLPWYLEGPVRFFDYPSEPMIVAPEKFAPDRFLPKTDLAPWFRAKERRFLLIRKRDRNRKDYVADVPSYLLAECGRYVILSNLPLDAGR